MYVNRLALTEESNSFAALHTRITAGTVHLEIVFFKIHQVYVFQRRQLKSVIHGCGGKMNVLEHQLVNKMDTACRG